MHIDIPIFRHRFWLCYILLYYLDFMQKVMYLLCDLVSHIVGIDIPDSSLVIGCATLSHIMQIYGENKIYEFTNFFLRRTECLYNTE